MKKKTSQKSNSSAQKAKKQKILNAVLAQIPFDGWTDSAYRRGLESVGVSRGEADLLFPQNIRDLIEFFGAMTDEAVQTRIIDKPGFHHLKIREKITFAVRAKLEFWQPHREAVRRMMYWYATPFHMAAGAKRLYRSVDMMWRAAGDNSTDFNFYTKRVLLTAVLKATIIYWLNDESDNCKATWEFLDRRIADVMKLGKTISLAKEWKPAEVIDMVRRKFKRT